MIQDERVRLSDDVTIWAVHSKIDGAKLADVKYERLGDGLWSWSIQTMKGTRSGQVKLTKPTLDHAKRVVRKSI